MDEMTESQRLAALEGWANNGAVAPFERLTAALNVIEALRVRENQRVRQAVVDTLRYARVYWADGIDDARQVKADFLEEAEELTRNWEMSPGWCCPFCEEVTCDDDCPLAPMRAEMEP